MPRKWKSFARTLCCALAGWAWLFAGTASAELVELGQVSDETAPAVCPPGFAIVDLSCTGRYCDNVKATCGRFAVNGAKRDGIQYWTDWFSEESSNTTQSFDGSTWPRLKTLYSIAVGLQCRGDYCDDMRLLMEIMHPQTRASGGVTMDSKAEAPFCQTSNFTVSEETEGSRTLRPQTFLRRVGCSGRYCDNLRFETCAVHRLQ